MVCDADDGAEDGLCGEVGGSEVGGGEGEELKGEDFRLHHEEARDGELDHGHPVVEGPGGEAWPAGSAGDEVDVEEEAGGKEEVGDCNGDGGAVETPVELPDEEVVHEDVQGGAEEEDIEGGGEEALGLEVSLAGFEGEVAGCADQDNAEVAACKDGNVFLGDDGAKDLFGGKPDDGYGNGAYEEEVHHPLHLETYKLLLAGTVGLGAKGVEAGDEPPVNGIACDVGGH